MKFLCIDYGTKRIGLAVSYGSLAEPFTIIENSELVIEKLLDVIQEEDITKIVMGISDRTMAEETRQFAEKLKKNVRIPIEFFDESFSSKQVQKKLIESQTKMSKRQQPIDHFAAAHVLQEYLDTQASL